MGTKDNPQKSNKILISVICVAVLALMASTGYGIYKIWKIDNNMQKQEKQIEYQNSKLDEQGSQLDQKNKEIKKIKADVEKSHLKIEKQKNEYQKKLQKKDNKVKKLEKQVEKQQEALSLKESLKRKQQSSPKVTTLLAASPKATEVSNKKVIKVKATAYTAYCEGCSGTTATGYDLRNNPSAKVIAVDPAVIPLGSKVHVEGYGYAVASDVGGGINGYEVDVFIPKTEDAYKFGVRHDVSVTILD